MAPFRSSLGLHSFPCCVENAEARGQGTVAAGSELAVLLSKIWAVSVAFFFQALSATDPALN